MIFDGSKDGSTAAKPIEQAASAEALENNPTYTHTLISEALRNTDLRIKQGKPVTQAFLFAALLWPALPARVLRLQDQGMPPIPAMQDRKSVV